jgi:hypothetical protein
MDCGSRRGCVPRVFNSRQMLSKLSRADPVDLIYISVRVPKFLIARQVLATVDPQLERRFLAWRVGGVGPAWTVPPQDAGAISPNSAAESPAGQLLVPTARGSPSGEAPCCAPWLDLPY